MVLFAYAQMPRANAYTDVSGKARDLNFCLGLHLHVCDQRLLWRVCAYAQTRLNLCCSLKCFGFKILRNVPSSSATDDLHSKEMYLPDHLSSVVTATTLTASTR